MVGWTRRNREASERLDAWWKEATPRERAEYSAARARESTWVTRFLVVWVTIGWLLLLAHAMLNAR